MPKTRALKPEFWTDEAVVSVGPYARLLLQGLWNYACDNGHVEDKPAQLKLRILPADDVDISALLDELAGAGLITRGDGVLHVGTIAKHNRIDKRFFLACKVPGCANPHDGDTQGAPRAPAVHTTGARSVHRVGSSGSLRAHDDDVEGEGEGEDIALPSGEAALSAVPRRGRRLDPGWTPSRDLADEMRNECPGVDLRAEHRKFVDYWTAKTGRDATKLDWQATWRNWIRRAHEQRARAPAGLDLDAAMARAQARDAQKGLTA